MQGVPYSLSGQALGDAKMLLSGAASCSDDDGSTDRQSKKKDERQRLEGANEKA